MGMSGRKPIEAHHLQAAPCEVIQRKAAHSADPENYRIVMLHLWPAFRSCLK